LAKYKIFQEDTDFPPSPSSVGESKIFCYLVLAEYSIKGESESEKNGKNPVAAANPIQNILAAARFDKNSTKTRGGGNPTLALR